MIHNTLILNGNADFFRSAWFTNEAAMSRQLFAHALFAVLQTGFLVVYSVPKEVRHAYQNQVPV